ncbi:type II secretion system F family protein [Streptomyces sp. NBC_00006]|uniref:type II secretion system F family protein n=1 Tax=Streptomyces sp. NBC_00006 TaxID=2975619 RepID=UPI00224F67F1|nr:type II secretion system F family protein [Streptomyces sp. NBC_00006]MCX5532810.1 type II secretion system F family protein [Streptomyces sp. NBC_00006]
MNVVHRLGAVLCIAVMVMWLVREVAARRAERALRRRVRLVFEVAAAESARRAVGLPAGVRRWVPVAGAVCAGFVLVGGVAGVVVGVVCGVGVWRWWRGREEGVRAGVGAGARGAAVRQLPLACDLLASCLAAGAGPVEAARAVGEALGGPVGRGFERGAAQVRLGGELGVAWRELAAVPGADGLVRLLERAGESGAPAAAPVARFATECRAERGRRATTVARRAAVAITAPVSLCFLPAFLVVGVVPVVIGLGGGVFGGR